MSKRKKRVEVGENIPEEEGSLKAQIAPAPPEEEGKVVEPVEEAQTTAIVVANPPGTEKTVSTWEWTKAKRKAFRQVMDGRQLIDIATDLGIHRNTLRNWMLAPEWVNEMRQRVQEKQLSSKLRRINGFEELTDKVMAAASKAVDGEEDEDGHRHMNTNQAGMLLKESRELVKVERELYGEAPAKGGGGGGGTQQVSPVNINIGQLPVGASDAPRDTLAAVSFKDFMLQVSKPGEVVEGETVEEALVSKTRELLQTSDVLDTLHEEDKARERIEQAKEEASKRRR